jgi:rod shape-determining protein MreC
MLKRPHYIALGLVVLLTLVLLNLPSQKTARWKLGIGSLFLPLFGLAGSAQHLAGKTGDALLPRSELTRQNEALRRENQELQLKLVQAAAAAREADRLRQILGWQPRLPWKVKLGSVVLREPSNWWRTVQIDLGERDGMRANLPVLTPEGYLVGRIGSVSLTHSQVVLLGDPSCRVSARVDNEARDTGILGAAGPLNSGFLELNYLSSNARLQPGQEVKTAGNGGIFPPGIPVGKIVDAQTVEYGFGVVAQVKLAANLSALDEVWVVLSSP